MPMKRPKRSLAANVSALASAAPSGPSMDWEDIEILLTQTDCDPEDIHYRAAVLRHVRQT
jgi:hypothetical protein